MAEEATIPHDYSRKQWKYVGYRDFCEFAASDHDFLLLRRFDKLTTRALLALQDEIVELEDQLESFENRLMQSGASDVHNGTFREEKQEVRVALVKEIHSKLRIYCQWSEWKA